MERIKKNFLKGGKILEGIMVEITFCLIFISVGKIVALLFKLFFQG